MANSRNVPFWKSGKKDAETENARRLQRAATPVVEALENRQLMTGSVASLTLIDADTDQVIGSLADGATLNLATLPTLNLNVRAETSGVVESVRFDLNGTKYRVENSAPYALAGDKGGNYHGWTPALGAHTLAATPYDANSGSGTAGAAMGISFTVVNQALAAPSSLTVQAVSPSQVNLAWLDSNAAETGFVVERSGDGTNFSRIASVGADVTSYADTGLSAGTYWYRVCAHDLSGTSTFSNVASAVVSAPAPTPAPTSEAVVRLVLVNADTDEDLMVLTDGVLLDLSALPTRNLNVRAEVEGSVESVTFALNGALSVENHAPYALAGDATGDFRAWTPTLGLNTLTATPYTLDKAGGTAGASLSVGFQVVDGSTPTTVPAAPLSLSAAATSSSQVRLTWMDLSGDESGFVIEGSTDGVHFGTVGKAAAGATTYTVAELSASTTYHFRVRAYNAAGTSAASNVASATTAADTTETPTTGLRPGAETTGPTVSSSQMRTVSGFYATQNGAVYENLIITGTVTIKADNVTFRNCIFRVSGHYAVKATDETYSGTLVENCELTGALSAAVVGSNFTLRNSELHHMAADAIKAKWNATIEGNWIHHLGMSEGAHADGIQVRKGGNIVMRGNFFDMPKGVEGTRSNACIFLQSADGPVHGVIIEGNWLNGGNYTIHADSGVTGLVIRDNYFGRDNKYGVKSLNGAETTWKNNVWWDTLQVIAM